MIIKLISIWLIFSLPSLANTNDSIEFLQWSQGHKELFEQNKKFVRRLQKKFNNDEIHGLELIIAEKSSVRVESRFGHAMFRFVDSDNDPGNDITVSFVADVDSPEMSTVGGVTGKYAIYPVFKSMRLFIKQYIKDDGRPLERHIIPSSFQMRKDLHLTIMKWWQDVLDGQEQVYLSALKNAKEDANKKGEKLFGKDNFEVFEMSFNEGYVYSLGIIEKTRRSTTTFEQKNKELYYQAYRKAYSEVIKYYYEGAAVLNLGQELWVVKLTEELININEQDFEKAKSLAKKKLKTDSVKLFSRFDIEMNSVGYYAMKLDADQNPAESLNVIKKQRVELNLKNLEVKGVVSENMGKYTFFTNNCATAVIRLLKDANYPHKKRVGVQGRVPVKLNKWMSRSLLSPYPPLYIKNAENLKEKLSKLLGLKRKQFEDYSFPIHQWDNLSKNLNDNDHFLFYNIYNDILEEEYIEKVRENLTGRVAPNYNILHGLIINDRDFYNLCSSKICIESLKGKMKRTWSRKEIKKTKKLVKRTGNNTFIHKGLLKRKEVITHLKLLKYIDRKFGD